METVHKCTNPVYIRTLCVSVPVRFYFHINWHKWNVFIISRFVQGRTHVGFVVLSPHHWSNLLALRTFLTQYPCDPSRKCIMGSFRSVLSRYFCHGRGPGKDLQLIHSCDWNQCPPLDSLHYSDHCLIIHFCAEDEFSTFLVFSHFVHISTTIECNRTLWICVVLLFLDYTI